MLDLRPVFATLATPTPSGSGTPMFTAAELPGTGGFRIARDIGNCAVLLIDASGQEQMHQAPYVLEHLRIEHARACTIRQLDGTEASGLFTLVSCTSTDVTLREYFLLVLGTLIANSDTPPTSQTTSDAIATIVELFRSLQSPPRKSVQGLWGELFLIAEARHPAALLHAWHATPGDRYDFNSGKARLEVKSVAGSIRQHHFSLAQLSPPNGTTALVASLFVERAGGGASLAELMAELRARMAKSSDLLVRMETIIAATLGGSLQASLSERFDRDLARSSLVYVRLEDVPRIDATPPPAVTDVRFTSDLRGVPGVDVDVISSDHGIEFFAALAGGRLGPA